MKTEIRSRILLFAAIVFAAVPAFCADKIESSVTGAAQLGLSKTQVLNMLGMPDSPPKFDFFYEKGKTELVVCFDDKTEKSTSVIVRNGGAEIFDRRDTRLAT